MGGYKLGMQALVDHKRDRTWDMILDLGPHVQFLRMAKFEIVIKFFEPTKDQTSSRHVWWTGQAKSRIGSFR